MIRFMDACWGVVLIGLLTVILPVVMELVIPRMFQYVNDHGIKASDMDVIIRGALIMLGAALVGGVATVIQGLYRARLSQGIAYDLRNALFRHIVTLPCKSGKQIRESGQPVKASWLPQYFVA